MRTIELVGTVSPDRTLRLTVQVPFDVPPGEHRVILVIDRYPMLHNGDRPPLNFPVDDYGPWPQSLSLHREDLYDDSGR